MAGRPYKDFIKIHLHPISDVFFELILSQNNRYEY
jgi:hypothetical protein